MQFHVPVPLLVCSILANICIQYLITNNCWEFCLENVQTDFLGLVAQTLTFPQGQRLGNPVASDKACNRRVKLKKHRLIWLITKSKLMVFDQNSNL